MTFVGLNGFGRIGKCIFLLLLNNDNLHIKAINAPDYDISKIESYLKNDSVHKYSRDFTLEIVDENSFRINGHQIFILRDRDAKNLDWRSYGIDVVIDASGVYLTEEKAKQHDVEKLIMSAPAKDDTPLFVYGANHQQYQGEKIISNASCTTNCITPVLRHLEDSYGIRNANFTTIHAATASQKVVDTAHTKSRTNRSIFNNIIPHTTGASSSIFKVLPKLDGKVVGTSVRVPVNNVSLVDLNVELASETSLNAILETMAKDSFLEVCEESLVSSDFISSTCPSIVDKKACMHLGGNRYKIMVWYDNEWSYAHQLVKMAEVMEHYQVRNPCFIDNLQMADKNVLLRLDLNLPIHEGVITSDYRLQSSLPTICKILESGYARLIIMSHMGRPKGKDKSCSLLPVCKLLGEVLNTEIGFLEHGLSLETLHQLDKKEHKIYVLENLRFHEEETKYKDLGLDNEAIHSMRFLGDVYINDAFGCLHRDHLSIAGVQYLEKGYGYLVHKELEALHLLTKNPYKQKILAIIGGGKMDDKMELLKTMCKKVDTIFICGGNINSLLKKDMREYLEEISSHKSKIVLMEDGLCARNFDENPVMKDCKFLENDENFFDAGLKSLQNLHSLIRDHDIVFWNGTLGVVENEKYKKGSELCVQFLENEMERCPKKKVIVGGGDTGGFANKYDHHFTHISTGGGASIEYISFDRLVGLDQFMVDR